MRFGWIALTTMVVGACLWMAGRLALGFERVGTDMAATPPADNNFSHGRLARVLQEHVIDGGVDYQSLSAQRAELEQYVATLAKTGPRTTPELFPSGAGTDAQLAYYLNAYNALVLYAVVTHWPIRSVNDVRGPLEPRQGLRILLRTELRARW